LYSPSFSPSFPVLSASGSSALAAASALAGLLVERWLIFAEATHTVALYYPTPR